MKVSKERKAGKGLDDRMAKRLQLRVLDLITLELRTGASSGAAAFGGVLHLNDFLHSAGMITDDCWNNVKGLTNVNVIVPLGTSTLKTLVEAGSEAAPLAKELRGGLAASENAEDNTEK